MIYQFKITVRDIQPTIWRELLIEPEMKMDELHYIIQTTMLWTAQQTYEFQVGDKTYGEPEDEGSTVLDAMETAIEDVFNKAGDSALYLYDDGAWQMDLELVKKAEKDPKAEYPQCVGGKRNGPPEEAGGPEGYATLLLAIADTENPDRAELLEIIGEDFDPEHFDVAEINAEFSDPDNWEEEGEDFEDEDEEDFE
jgi:Plasmid pRiA4b ORF-3-like protein